MRAATILAMTLFGIIFAESALASRTVLAPPYLRRIIFFLRGPADGTKIGAIMSVQINLTNLSAIEQTGTVKIDGTTAWAAEVARTEHINTRVMICGTTAAGATNGIPSSARFSIPANGSSSVTATVLFTSTYDGAGPGGHTVFDATFTPIVRLEIEQDRGAVNGTLTPLWDGPVNGYTLCDGTVLAGYGGSISASETRTGVPLLINGGRPF